VEKCCFVVVPSQHVYIKGQWKFEELEWGVVKVNAEGVEVEQTTNLDESFNNSFVALTY
jgi:hypothetical protein